MDSSTVVSVWLLATKSVIFITESVIFTRVIQTLFKYLGYLRAKNELPLLVHMVWFVHLNGHCLSFNGNIISYGYGTVRSAGQCLFAMTICPYTDAWSHLCCDLWCFTLTLFPCWLIMSPRLSDHNTRDTFAFLLIGEFDTHIITPFTLHYIYVHPLNLASWSMANHDLDVHVSLH